MSDMSFGEFQLRGVLLALGHRTAATAAALTALISLLFHVPLKTACLRGGATWLALILLTRATHWLVGCTYPRAQPNDEQDDRAPAQAGTKS